jgi:osmoprotectant transport system substrate-binding protein
MPARPALPIGFGEQCARRARRRRLGDFTESKILAEIYSQALKAKGVDSSTKLGIGSREIYIKALQDGSISAVPEYTGNLLLNFDANAAATTADEVEKSLPAVLPPGIKVLKSLARC